MNVDRNLVAITLALCVSPLSACDTDTNPDAEEAEFQLESAVVDPPAVDPPTATATAHSADFAGAGHVELGAVLATPWVADAMARHNAEFTEQLDVCAKVFENASAVTFGVNDDAFEVYITGQLDIEEASACGDKIDGDSQEPTAAMVLDEDLFVIYRGELEPSRARLSELLALDPTPNKDQPIWMTGSAITLANDSPVERVQMWANPAKGLDAHVQVDFHDEQSANDIFGQASLGLTALRMSNDASSLASAVELKSSGQSMTVEVHATQAQMASVLTKVATRHDGHHGHTPPATEDQNAGVHFEIHTSN